MAVAEWQSPVCLGSHSAKRTKLGTEVGTGIGTEQKGLDGINAYHENHPLLKTPQKPC